MNRRSSFSSSSITRLLARARRDAQVRPRAGSEASHRCRERSEAHLGPTPRPRRASGRGHARRRDRNVPLGYPQPGGRWAFMGTTLLPDEAAFDALEPLGWTRVDETTSAGADLWTDDHVNTLGALVLDFE